MAEPVHHVANGRPYKTVSLYNAANKTTRTVKVKTNDFATPEELDAYCRKLREDQKHANKLVKEQRVAEKVRAVMEREPEPLPVIVPDAAPPAATDLDLTLDPGTGNTIVLYGSSKRGKTTLMMHLYAKYFKDKSLISTLFSGNPQLKIYRGDPNLLVSYGFTARSAKYIALSQYINVKTCNRYRFLMMFDDIIDQKHAPVMNRLVLTYRNSNISSILCLQYSKMLAKANRASVNHTIVFGSNTAEDEKNVIDTLLKPYLTAIGIKKYADQVAFYRLVTRDHGFIYLDNIHSRMTFHRLALAPH